MQKPLLRDILDSYCTTANPIDREDIAPIKQTIRNALRDPKGETQSPVVSSKDTKVTQTKTQVFQIRNQN